MKQNSWVSLGLHRQATWLTSCQDRLPTLKLFNVHAMLPAGLARGHHGNTADAIRVERLYGVPVLLSGLGTLVLSKTDISSLDHHFKISLERLQKLHKSTPAAFVFFMAG